MYTSTRSKLNKNASTAIIDGLAFDGGLYIKGDLEQIDINSLKNKSYKEIAFIILRSFLDDFSDEDVFDAINKAYDSKFAYEDVVNVKKCNDAYFLELFHGPTMAFKDVALSILPLLMVKSKKIQKQNNKTVILTATSGDTGSAALSGFHADENTEMVVLYPTNGVSLIQEKQMLSFKNERLHPVAIKGNFDDAQTLVKKIFSDENLRAEIIKNNIDLTSANSINIGRLIPQIVYYFYTYIDLLKKEEIKETEKINFVVPTGNFGNILACYIAKHMGLPVSKIICASNSNNVLTDFFNKHEYNRNREFYKTLSPSMDILISSNLERLLYYLSGDEKVVSGLMKDLNTSGLYKLPEDIKNKLGEFYAEYSTEEETLEAIKKVYEENKYLIDTHTAVAYSVFKKYQENTSDETKTVIASTAHPYKFPKAVCKALGIDSSSDEFTLINVLNEVTGVEIPNPIKKLKCDFEKEVICKEEAYNYVCNKIVKRG